MLRIRPKIGAIHNSSKHRVTINQVQLPMRLSDKFMVIKTLNNQFWEFLEPITLREASNCAVEIMDEKYEKNQI